MFVSSVHSKPPKMEMQGKPGSWSGRRKSSSEQALRKIENKVKYHKGTKSQEFSRPVTAPAALMQIPPFRRLTDPGRSKSDANEDGPTASNQEQPFTSLSTCFFKADVNQNECDDMEMEDNFEVRQISYEEPILKPEDREAPVVRRRSYSLSDMPPQEEDPVPIGYRRPVESNKPKSTARNRQNQEKLRQCQMSNIMNMLHEMKM